jgi:hypothetical protein
MRSCSLSVPARLPEQTSSWQWGGTGDVFLDHDVGCVMTWPVELLRVVSCVVWGHCEECTVLRVRDLDCAGSE